MEQLPEYGVIQHDDPKAFSTTVAIALRQGWKLVGGVSIATAPGKIIGSVAVIYCQAVVRQVPLIEEVK